MYAQPAFITPNIAMMTRAVRGSSSATRLRCGTPRAMSACAMRLAQALRRANVKVPSTATSAVACGLSAAWRSRPSW